MQHFITALFGCSLIFQLPALSLMAAPQASQSVHRTLTAPAGTILRVRVNSTLSTKANKAGQRFSGTLAEPLMASGVAIAPRGATVHGLIAESNSGGRVKGRARLSVRVTGIEANGRNLPVSTSVFVAVARGTKTKDATKVGIGSGAGAVIGAIAGGGTGAAIGAAAGAGAGTGVVLATKGDAAVIPSEAIVSVRLRNALTVTR
ncbi:MAG TPA: hypothetical protein VM120_03870 [Bryobacteraceae bacterium]|nr:hypothetical protein [Bryobacteraceae bacterium]